MRYVLDLPPGILSDETNFSLGGRWTEGNNVRFVRGRPEVIGGWREIDLDTPATGIQGLHVLTRDGVPAIFAGSVNAADMTAQLEMFTITANYIGLNDGDDWTKTGVTPPSGLATYDVLDSWRFDNYGEDLLFSPRDPFGLGVIYQQSGSSAFAALTNAPEANDFCVADQRQVIAFGTEEESGGATNYRIIRGSDIENITDWTTTSTNNAFEEYLDCEGNIIAGRQVGPYLMVWTENELWRGTYVGAGAQVWRFEKEADNCGVLSRDVIAVLGSTVFWLGSDYKFRQWAPGVEPVIIPCSVQDQIEDSAMMSPLSMRDAVAVDNPYRNSLIQFAKAVPIVRHNEVWWLYPDTRDAANPYEELPDNNTRYVAYNFAEGFWFTGQLERTCGHQASALSVPIMSDGTKVYYHELDHYGDYNADELVSWSLKAEGLYLSSGPDAWKNIGLKKFLPDFQYSPLIHYVKQNASDPDPDDTDNGDITVTVSGRQYPQSTEAQIKQFTVSPTDEKEDFLGENFGIISVEFSGVSEAASGGNPKRSWVRFGTPAFEIEPTGTQ